MQKEKQRETYAIQKTLSKYIPRQVKFPAPDLLLLKSLWQLKHWVLLKALCHLVSTVLILDSLTVFKKSNLKSTYI